MVFWGCGDRVEVRHQDTTVILQTVGQALAGCAWEAHASAHGGIWELIDTTQAQRESAAFTPPSRVALPHPLPSSAGQLAL